MGRGGEGAKSPCRFCIGRRLSFGRRAPSSSGHDDVLLGRHSGSELISYHPLAPATHSRFPCVPFSSSLFLFGVLFLIRSFCLFILFIFLFLCSCLLLRGLFLVSLHTLLFVLVLVLCPLSILFSRLFLVLFFVFLSATYFWFPSILFSLSSFSSRVLFLILSFPSYLSSLVFLRLIFVLFS